MTSLFELKKNRAASMNKLAEASKAVSEGKGGRPAADDRYWQPTKDKAGNGYAVIRFLDTPPGEEDAFVRLWSHGFQNKVTGKWYIQNSRTTLGEADPMSEFNQRLYATAPAGADRDHPIRKQVTSQKRNLHFISNILVIKDPGNPANEGKVFLFKYGKKIFDKLNAKMNPEFEDQERLNPFDLWEGANFRLRIRKKDGFPNYDESDFDNASAIGADDQQIEAVWKQTHSLVAEIAPDKFKSYDELQKMIEQVFGDNTQNLRAKAAAAEPEEDSRDIPRGRTINEDLDAPETMPSEPDDDMKMFQKLANGE